MSKLKTCPFCGKVATIWEGTSGKRIVCEKCEIGTIWSNNESNLVRNWNKRNDDTNMFNKQVKKLTIDIQKVHKLAEDYLNNITSIDTSKLLRIVNNIIRITSKHEKGD